MRYGLIGEKLGHSFSKEIHEKLGRYGYELKELAPEEVPVFLQLGDFKGINVTIPYKKTVLPLCDEAAFFDNSVRFRQIAVMRNEHLIDCDRDLPCWFIDLIDGFAD